MINYAKLAIYASSALIVGVLFWRVSAWHSGYKQLKSAQAALQAEIDCKEGSHCAFSVLQRAQRDAKAIADAQNEANRQKEEARKTREQAAQEAANNDANTVRKNQGKLSVVLAKPHTLTCKEWLQERIPCAMQ